MGLVGKSCPGCGYCTHANKDLMRCFPDSKDCEKKYDLEEADFNGPCNCDFFDLKDI